MKITSNKTERIIERINCSHKTIYRVAVTDKNGDIVEYSAKYVCNRCNKKFDEQDLADLNANNKD